MDAALILYIYMWLVTALSLYLNVAGLRQGPGKVLLRSWKVLEIFVAKSGNPGQSKCRCASCFITSDCCPLRSGVTCINEDHTVLPVTRTFIHQWSELSDPHSPATELHCTLPATSSKSGPKDQVALHYYYTSPSHWCTTHEVSKL